MIITAAAALAGGLGASASPVARTPTLSFTVAPGVSDSGFAPLGGGICLGDRRVTDPAADGGIAWSPDGSRVAFFRQTGPLTADVFVSDADGSHLRNLTRWKRAVQLGSGLVAGRNAHRLRGVRSERRATRHGAPRRLRRRGRPATRPSTRRASFATRSGRRTEAFSGSRSPTASMSSDPMGPADASCSRTPQASTGRPTERRSSSRAATISHSHGRMARTFPSSRGRRASEREEPRSRRTAHGWSGSRSTTPTRRSGTDPAITCTSRALTAGTGTFSARPAGFRPGALRGGPQLPCLRACALAFSRARSATTCSSGRRRAT